MMHAHASLGRQFVQDGFVLLPSTFTVSEIAELRAALIKAFADNKPPFTPHFSATALFQEPLRSIVFRNARLIGALRELLGDDFLLINEMSAHDSFFSGWHTDTSSPEGKAGHEFHWSPGFAVVNVAIYLQENCETGGGMDIVPGSYLRDDPVAIGLRREHGFSATHVTEPKGDPYRNTVTLPSRAGDVVIFHLRSSHRASIPTRKALNDKDRKLALFFIAGPNNASTRRYRAWLDEYARMNETTRPTIPDDFQRFMTGIESSII